ncbi:MAG: hypothetical protein OEW04_00675 [Nitrospirota bacterium]|nr:hypothetical protein [Nitrospirota bacterium]
MQTSCFILAVLFGQLAGLDRNPLGSFPFLSLRHEMSGTELFPSFRYEAAFTGCRRGIAR